MEGITRYVAYYQAQKNLLKLKGYVKFIFIVQLSMAVVLMLIIIISAPRITEYFSFGPEFTNLLYIVAFIVPFRILGTSIARIFVARKKVLQGTISYHVVENIILLVGMLYIIHQNLSLYAAVILLAVSIIATAIINVILLGLIRPINFTGKSKYAFSEWIKFSLPLLFTGVIAYLLKWTDNLVIAKFLTLEHLGLYSIAYSLSVYIFFVPGLLSTMFTPVLSELIAKNSSMTKEVFTQVRNIGTLTSIFFGLPLIVFSSEILGFLFGSEFISGGLSLAILSAFFILSVYFSISKVVLLVKKKTNFLFYNTILFASINLVLNVFFVKMWGIEGIAFASGLTALMLPMSEMIEMRKFFKPESHVIYMAKALTIAVVSGLVIKIASNTIYSSVLISLVLYTFLFVVFSICFKLATKEDIQMMVMLEKKIGFKIPLIRWFL